jgi:hypothetical protein
VDNLDIRIDKRNRAWYEVFEVACRAWNMIMLAHARARGSIVAYIPRRPGSRSSFRSSMGILSLELLFECNESGGVGRFESGT